MFEVTSGPFHRAAEPAPLVAQYLYLRHKRKLPAARALISARADLVRSEGRAEYAPTIRAQAWAGNWQSLDSMPRHTPARRRAYYCDKLPDGWRGGRDAHDVARAEGAYRFDSRGWFGDDDCGHAGGGIFIGVVCQLPARNRVCQYVPAVRNTESDGWTLYPADRFDSALECARAADGYAESAAEIEREYWAAWQAGVQYADKLQESRDAWAEAKQAARDWCGDRAEFHAAGLAPEAASVQRARARYAEIVAKACEDSAAAREAAAEIESDWNRGDNAGAFRDGAGLPCPAAR